jgi:integrase
MPKDRALPRGVFAKGASYYLVTAQGERRIWTRLSRIKDGLPAMHRALSEVLDAPKLAGMLPSLIAEWEREVMVKHAPTTQRDERARGAVIAQALADFHASKLQPPKILKFLANFTDTPRTHNLYRAQLRELMRFAIDKGYRDPGTNPVEDVVRTLRTPPRKRYITDSELRRIKVAAMRAKDRHGHDQDTASGPMLCALIDMAYLTGQAIGDLLDLRWERDRENPNAPHLQAGGIWFARKKLAKSTQEEVLITWTPKLRDVVRRLKELKLARPGACDWVFISRDGVQYTYSGVASSWRRARNRAGITDCTFHDIRAKALTDKEEREGMQAARIMGSHSTEAQTSDYVRSKGTKKTGATR